MIQLAASTHGDFHVAVRNASDAIGRAGGWILSHQFFSSSLAMLAFQIPAPALGDLGEELSAARITLHQPVPETGGKLADVAVQLSITVLHNGPDLTRPVPAFG
jgi:hypothetical protein